MFSKKINKSVAFLKLDFKKRPDGSLIILDVGDGFNCDHFGTHDVRAKAVNYLSEHFSSVYGSSVIPSTHMTSSFTQDFGQNLQFIGANKFDTLEFNDDSISIFVEANGTYALAHAARMQVRGVNSCNGQPAFQIINQDKLFFYALTQQYGHLPEDVWFKNLDLKALKPKALDGLIDALPNAQHGYVLKPSNADIATGFSYQPSKKGCLLYLQEVMRDVIKLQQQYKVILRKKLQLCSNPAIGQGLLKPNIKQLLDNFDKMLLAIGKQIKQNYIIQPCYRNESMKGYEPTGRAFITLIFDHNTKKIEFQVMDAVWILPKAKLSSNEVPSQIAVLANHENSTAFIPPPDLIELSRWLITSLTHSYKAVFTQCFELDLPTVLATMQAVGLPNYFNTQIMKNNRYYLIEDMKDAEERYSQYISMQVIEVIKFEMPTNDELNRVTQNNEDSNNRLMLRFEHINYCLRLLKKSEVKSGWIVTAKCREGVFNFMLGHYSTAKECYLEAQAHYSGAHPVITDMLQQIGAKLDSESKNI